MVTTPAHQMSYCRDVLPPEMPVKPRLDPVPLDTADPTTRELFDAMPPQARTMNVSDADGWSAARRRRSAPPMNSSSVTRSVMSTWADLRPALLYKTGARPDLPGRPVPARGLRAERAASRARRRARRERAAVSSVMTATCTAPRRLATHGGPGIRPLKRAQGRGRPRNRECM